MSGRGAAMRCCGLQGSPAQFVVDLADGFGNALSAFESVHIPTSLKQRADEMWNVAVHVDAAADRTADSGPGSTCELLEYNTERCGMTGPIRVRYTPHQAGMLQLQVHLGLEGYALIPLRAERSVALSWSMEYVQALSLADCAQYSRAAGSR